MKTYTLSELKRLKEKVYDEETAGLPDHADHFDRAGNFLDWLKEREMLSSKMMNSRREEK